ncbi:MAG: hypothetical protein IJB02_03015 [Oscillospiraceae bacterium]|nr:hypothetical protein [Oscillospiraceae bacterium]
MFSKELKRLSRRELVDIIYQLKKNEQEKQDQIAALENELQEKRIRISVAGSIAEAAKDITNIFSVAQTTADLYLHEIACMKEETEQKCAKMLEEARKKVEEILSDGKQQCMDLEARYQCDYQKWQQLQAEIQKLEQKSR